MARGAAAAGRACGASRGRQRCARRQLVRGATGPRRRARLPSPAHGDDHRCGCPFTSRTRSPCCWAFCPSHRCGVLWGDWRCHGRAASIGEVQAALESMRASSLMVRRQAYGALRDLTHAAYFSDPSTWTSLRYPGPRAIGMNHPGAHAAVHDPIATAWRAAGACTAVRTRGAARDRVRRRHRRQRRRRRHHGRTAERRRAEGRHRRRRPAQAQSRLPPARVRGLSRRCTRRRPARKTADKAINILQGRCVGGSTTVNWTSSFRTPSPTLAYWREHFGLHELHRRATGARGSCRPSGG